MAGMTKKMVEKLVRNVQRSSRCLTSLQAGKKMQLIP